jgi:hypothetical protein
VYVDLDVAEKRHHGRHVAVGDRRFHRRHGGGRGCTPQDALPAVS